MSERKPIAKGLFDWPPQDTAPTLLGSRCRQCGETVFPALRDCPLCGVPDTMEPQRLRGAGTLHDYTVAERGPEGFPVPYVQAYVRLDDGPVVYTLLTDVDPHHADLKLGVRMTMLLDDIIADGNCALVGWKFRPVATPSA